MESNVTISSSEDIGLERDLGSERTESFPNLESAFNKDRLVESERRDTVEDFECDSENNIECEDSSKSNVNQVQCVKLLQNAEDQIVLQNVKDASSDYMKSSGNMDTQCSSQIHENQLEESVNTSIGRGNASEIREDEEFSSDKSNGGEVDKLLSDISELVDSSSNQSVKSSVGKGVGLDKIEFKDMNNDKEELLNEDAEITPVEQDEKSMSSVTPTSDENKSVDSASLIDSADKYQDNEQEDNEGGTEHQVNHEYNVCNDKVSLLHNRPVTEAEEIKSSEKQKCSTSTNESAFQRLASLGVIADEVTVVVSKESALKKLVSRGAISITSTGVGLSTSSIDSTVSITPAHSKNKSGPKSAMRQKAKKIKIDPGNSMDIDQDFNSLISFLSTGANKDKTPVVPNPVEENNGNNLNILPEKVSSVKPEVEYDTTVPGVNENEGLGSAMDLDVSDDKSIHETDSESHDGYKSCSHGSDHNDENDDRISATTSKLKNVIEEGSAEILLSATKNVFYNKVQEFNRDMSIAALTVFSEMHQQDPRTRNKGKIRKAPDINSTDANSSDVVDENIFEPGKKVENGITILEALSATGLRSIRYAKEIPGVKEVVANDLSEDAVETIKKNIEHNAVEDIVNTTLSDASLLMYQHQASQEWYDAIDLDPYGCPSRFLDSAVQAVRDGGLLLVTCTDMAVLAGNSPETCYVKYGAISLRSPACHEMALRIALQCIESHANRYGRYILPLLSFSADFYIRLIVQVYTSPVTCKKTTSKLSMVYQCVGCHTHTLHPLGQTSQLGPNTQTKFSLSHGPPVNTACFHCHHKHYMGGPIWSAPMCNSKFLESMLRVVENGKFSTSKRMQGMLEVIREELPDVPLYYTISGLCTKLHCQAIPLIDIRSAILNTGYRVSSSHAAPTAIKTNAPTKIIWDIMRCWVHMNPVSQKRLIPGSVPAAIILEPPNLIANFDIHPKARPSSSMRKLLRYQQNPEKNWGPGMRARCNNANDVKDEKRRVNQNKNKNKKNIDIIEVVTIDDEDETVETSAATELITSHNIQVSNL